LQWRGGTGRVRMECRLPPPTEPSRWTAGRIARPGPRPAGRIRPTGEPAARAADGRPAVDGLLLRTNLHLGATRATHPLVVQLATALGTAALLQFKHKTGPWPNGHRSRSFPSRSERRRCPRWRSVLRSGVWSLSLLKICSMPASAGRQRRPEPLELGGVMLGGRGLRRTAGQSAQRELRPPKIAVLHVTARTPRRRPGHPEGNRSQPGGRFSLIPGGQVHVFGRPVSARSS